jgi:hypothetical protein
MVTILLFGALTLQVARDPASVSLRERVFPGSAFIYGFEDTPIEENFEIA